MTEIKDGNYAIRCGKTTDKYLELVNGAPWNKIQLQQQNTSQPEQQWEVKKTSDGSYTIDNLKQSSTYVSPLADNSNGRLFASALSPKENKILRWIITHDPVDNLWKIGNAAFHDKVIDVENDPKDPPAGAHIILFADKGTRSDIKNQRWAFERIDTY
ncbi:hypothetical protein BBP40_009395 [Aspergillus hancockii]|nr:hypothetical protein BBP40_009395 [Aspergillus hancockii]